VTTQTAGGRSFTGQVFSPIAARVDLTNGSRILSNRPGLRHDLWRLRGRHCNKLPCQNRWFSRVAFSYNNYVEHPGAGSIQNPTRTDTTGGTFSGPQVDGGQFAPRSGGFGQRRTSFYNAKMAD
jgi:hypothetical protein